MEISIIQAFSDILSSNREKGEEYLFSIRKKLGFIPTLMKICLGDFSFEIKQLSASHLESLTKRENLRVLPRNDINYLRTNIVSYLKFSIEEKIRDIFEQVAYNYICQYLFPLEEIISQINNALESDNYDLIFSGINMIFQILRVNHYTHLIGKSFLEFISKKLPMLNEILNCILCEGITGVENFFPNLFLNPSESAISSSSKDFCWKCILLILKLFEKCLYTDLFYALNIEIWWTKFKKILEFSLEELENPLKNEPQYTETLCAPWEAKITVTKILTAFFDLDEYQKSLKIIKEGFINNWAASFFEIILLFIIEKNNQFLPSLIAANYISYIAKALKHSFIYELFKLQIINSTKPIIFILLDRILPTLYLEETELKLWNEHPIQSLSNGNRIPKERYWIQTFTDLLINFIKNDNDIEIINYFTKTFPTASTIKKEALMAMLEILIRLCIRSNYIEIIFSFVDQELDSKLKFLRFRVCRFYSELAFSKVINESQQIIIYRKVYSLLQDPELIVKFEAAKNIPYMLTSNVVKEMTSSEINFVLSKYISLIKENYTKYILNPIYEIIKRTSTIYTISHWLGVVENLIQIFIDWNQIEDEEIEINRSNIICIILAIVHEFNQELEDIAKISRLLIPIFEFCFANERSSSLPCLNLLKDLLKFSPPESLNNLCRYAELIKNIAINNWKFCNNNALELFIYYIEKYSESVEIQIYLDLANISAENEHYKWFGRSILMGLMKYRKSLIDNFLPKFINYILNEFIDCEFICVALWNNPIVTLQALKEQNILASFIESICKPLNDDWIEYLSHKYIIAGICSLFLVIDDIPSDILKKFPLLFSRFIISWNQINTYLHNWYNSKNMNISCFNEKLSTFESDIYRCCADWTNGCLWKTPFEKMNIREFISTSLTEFNRKHPNLYFDIVRQLSEEEILIVDLLNK